jgi:choline-sulfatase
MDGQRLRAMAATDLDDNTIVIFISDHGDMLGERGLWYKMTFFEWSARVPLIVRAAGRFAPRRVASNVSQVDLLPTLLDLAGDGAPAPLADRIDGHSLVPLLQGDAQGWPDTALSEYLGEGAVAPVLMVRRGRYKYVYSEPDPDQLYDLAADPNELANQAGRAEYQELRRAFAAEVAERWKPHDLRHAVIDSQRRRRLVAAALMAGQHTAWDFQPHRDASKQYMRNHLDLNDLERRARFPTTEAAMPKAAHGE